MADVEYPVEGTGPFGVTPKTKAEKAADLEAVTKPEVTSVNPPDYTLDELNHRFNHIPPTGFTDPTVTIQGVND